MNKKLSLLLILSLTLSLSAKADIATLGATDFRGESFFSTASQSMQLESDDSNPSSGGSERHTMPPIKKLRIMIQNKKIERMNAETEFAPTLQEIYEGENEISEYASKEIKSDFEDMTPDGFDADEDLVEEITKRKLFSKHKKQRVKNDAVAEVIDSGEEIILDCERVDYDTPNYLMIAKGNVNVEFVKQKTIVKADVITFDRMNNTLKAEGNVRILKHGRVITGDYIFVDMNEENAIIENPLTSAENFEIRAQKGYVYGDRVVQENGSIHVSGSYPIEFKTAKRGPQTRKMLVPENQNLAEDMKNGVIKLTAKNIKITQKGDLETIAIKKGKLFKGDKILYKFPATKIYTNKNHDYLESNHWEIGSYRGLGLYTGPGWVFELPKGSVLKAMPILNYKSGFGIGAMGRFSSGTNQTMAAYGSAASKIIAYGRQRLDDNLFLQYGMNSYFDEWFLGRRRPKYGASLVYSKDYRSKDFLLKDRSSSFSHRLEGGYFQDFDEGGSYEKISAGRIGTTRLRYMAMVNQNFYEYKNKENLTAFSLGLTSQLSAALYGTGDTQMIGRIGPRVSLQYKRWMQDLVYYLTAYEDNSPMLLYDAFRYGTNNLSLREYFRVCKWLTVSWLGSINISDDSPGHKSFPENAFYISVGPDDVKFNLGYDFVRENLYCTVDIKTDAKGANVEYDTMEIKQDKKSKKENVPVRKTVNNYAAPTQPEVLKKAVVEDVRVMEDVL